MKRVIVMILAGMLIVSPAFGADDDSTPYMPYPETPQPAPAPAPAKPAKKPAKKPARKPAPKKPAPKKPASRRPAKPARPSSLQQGIALMQQEKYEQAKPYLLKAIQEERNNPNAWYWYGVYHEKTGGFHQAQYFYTKAITIDPAFEPLSRVVYHPEDPEKTPLWDPKRPARVYPVEAGSTGGLTQVPPGRSNIPTAPNDPELPHVPVYTPPEPGAAPFDGDAWGPAVYVPPSPEEVRTEGEHSPVYTPPEPQSVVAQAPATERPVLELRTTPPQTPTIERDPIIRADKPLYTPPEPGQTPPTPPAPTVRPQKRTTTPTIQTPTAPARRRASVPDSRVVRQTKKPAKSPAKPAAARRTQRRAPASRDIRPSTPAPARPTTPAPARPSRPTTPTRPEPQEPVRPVEPVTLPPDPPVRRQNNPELLPPVGQQAPDPGTVPETPPPPVGQGQY